MTEDQQLLEQIIARDVRAMGRLYERYLPRISRFLYRVVQDSEAIPEVANDVMLTVWTNASKFRGDSAVSTWILGIAYRKGLDAGRKQQRYRQVLSAVRDDGPHAPSGIAELVANRDLDVLLKALSPEQRAVAELCFGFGYSYPEIADMLDIPVNTVKTRMFYARQLMQAELTDSEDPEGGG
ncbi:MAG: RNA polymerase sigma factor [Pseudomonadota bacterium]